MAPTNARSSGEDEQAAGRVRPGEARGRIPRTERGASRQQGEGLPELGQSAGSLPSHESTLARLLSAAESLADALEPERAAQAIVDEAVRTLHCSVAVLLAPDEASGRYRLRAQAGSAGTFGADVGVSERDVASLGDRESEFSAGGLAPSWVHRLLSAAGSTTVMLVPLIREGTRLGLLALFGQSPISGLREAEAVAAFSRLAAAALARADQWRAMEQGAAESTLLLQIGQLLSATFDPDTIARVLVEEARDLLPCDLAAFYRYEPVTDTLQLRLLRGARHKRLEEAGLHRVSLDCLPATRRAAADGQPVAALWPEDGDLMALFGAALGIRTSLTVPLRARGAPLGFLFLGRRTRRPFNLAEAQLGFRLGALGALTLDNAQLYAGQTEQMRQLRAAQAQLIEAEKMASLGRIVAGVAHELNNPLAIVSGYAQMLLGEELPPSVHDALQRIDRGARRAAQVVRELLAFARQQPIAPTEIELPTLIREVLDALEATISAVGATVDLRFEEGLPPIVGDRLQLATVLRELVEGALRAIASRRGAGRLTIEATYRDRVTLAVSDDGASFPPEMLDRIFEPFATCDERGLSSSLGLSMCYGVVRAHGGRISAANNQGPGATLLVELPAAPSEA